MPLISADSVLRCVTLIESVSHPLKRQLVRSLKITNKLRSLCPSISSSRSRRRDLVTSLDSTPPAVSPTRVIFIFLCYAEASGTLPKLEGPKNDLKRLLEKYKYAHDDISGRIQIIADFDLEFTDIKGVTRRVQRIAPTISNIEQVLTSEAQGLAPQESLELWLGLHSNFNRKASVQGPGTGGLDLNDGSTISRERLSGWLRENVNPEAQIIVVADTCDSENILDLPLKFYRKGEILYQETRTNDETPGNLLVIGATMSGQSAESFKDTRTGTIHGLLTWFLLDTFDDGQKHTILRLLEILNRRIPHDQFKQIPVITSTTPASKCIRLFPE